MRFSEMSDQELIDMAIGLHESIYGIECYGCHDLQNYDGVCAELEKRGYAMSTSLNITKMEVEKDE